MIDPVAVQGGTAAMYLPGKIMKAGRSIDPDNATVPSVATAYVIDMTQPSPAWRQIGSMAFPRNYHNATILPDGTVVVTGGGQTTGAIDLKNAVYEAELWDPQTESWTTLARMHAPRLYHSTALLMPDGRVLVSGGGRFNGNSEPTDQVSGEFFAPPYLFKGPRPTIAAVPSQLTRGQTFTIETPDASRIAKVSLVRLGNDTHAFDMNQRFVPLSFSANTGALSVTAPSSANVAPPGYYMLFIVDTNGVPSIASYVRF
jgi:galactose oxidase-like protein/Kelch motif protein